MGLLSRIRQVLSGDRLTPEGIHIVGRVVLNVWRLLRSEVQTNVYTFENMAFHVLHRRIAKHSFRTLTSWFTSAMKWRTLSYYLERAQMVIELLGRLDVVIRTR